MKTFKKVLIVLGVIVAIPLIVALFVNKTYAVEEAIVINKPKSEVFDYAKHLKNQDDFSAWANLDPNMKKNIPWYRWNCWVYLSLGKRR